MALRTITIRVFRRPRVLVCGAVIAVMLVTAGCLYRTGVIIVSEPSPLPSQLKPTAGLFDREMIGKLNYDVWKQIVGYLVDDLRINEDFPNSPEIRGFAQTLRVTFEERRSQSKHASDSSGRYGHKVYGYLQPQFTGDHLFSIDMRKSYAACSSEFWLSRNSHPSQIRRVLTLEYSNKERIKSPVSWRVESPQIQLDSKEVYYFEFLEKAFDGRCTVEIMWKSPRQSLFHTIPNTNFAMAAKLDNFGRYTPWPVVAELLVSLLSNELQTHHRATFENDKIYSITDLDILPKCDIQMVQAHPHEVQPMTGVFEVCELKVYPIDDTWYSVINYKDGTEHGNEIIDTEVTTEVLSLYAKAFDERRKDEQFLRYLCGWRHCDSEIKLQRMEQTVNRNEGSRFLLELSITYGVSTVYTSEYVYLPAGTSELCHAENFQWRKDIDVYLVMTVKNVGYWLKHFIHNMEYIYDQTHDEHFEVIIVDFESVDLDVEGELRKSSLKRWKVINIEGRFWKTKGHNEAVFKYIRDSDSIVMTLDLHLTLSIGFVEYVRRHVVRGKTAFAPMFFRLSPGFTEVNPVGYWETDTYGLFAMYKADWVDCGGFDMEKYTVSWGGEDWDILDKALSQGIEVIRMRYPGLVHYYHSKAGMWDEDSKQTGWNGLPVHQGDNAPPNSNRHPALPFSNPGGWGGRQQPDLSKGQSTRTWKVLAPTDKQPAPQTKKQALGHDQHNPLSWRKTLEKRRQLAHQETHVDNRNEPNIRYEQPQYEDNKMEEKGVDQANGQRNQAENQYRLPNTAEAEQDTVLAYSREQAPDYQGDKPANHDEQDEQDNPEQEDEPELTYLDALLYLDRQHEPDQHEKLSNLDQQDKPDPPERLAKLDKRNEPAHSDNPAYDDLLDDLANKQVKLVNTRQQGKLASELPYGEHIIERLNSQDKPSPQAISNDDSYRPASLTRRHGGAQLAKVAEADEPGNPHAP